MSRILSLHICLLLVYFLNCLIPQIIFCMQTKRLHCINSNTESGKIYSLLRITLRRSDQRLLQVKWIAESKHFHRKRNTNNVVSTHVATPSCYYMRCDRRRRQQRRRHCVLCRLQHSGDSRQNHQRRSPSPKSRRLSLTINRHHSACCTHGGRIIFVDRWEFRDTCARARPAFRETIR